MIEHCLTCLIVIHNREIQDAPIRWLWTIQNKRSTRRRCAVDNCHLPPYKEQTTRSQDIHSPTTPSNVALSAPASTPITPGIIKIMYQIQIDTLYRQIVSFHVEPSFRGRHYRFDS